MPLISYQSMLILPPLPQTNVYVQDLFEGPPRWQGADPPPGGAVGGVGGAAQPRQAQGAEDGEHQQGTQILVFQGTLELSTFFVVGLFCVSVCVLFVSCHLLLTC